MARPEHFEIVRRGTESIAKWRKTNPNACLELSKVHLSEARLTNADLTGADFGLAYLRGVDLRGARLNGAHLAGVDLRGAQLDGADFSEANLTCADLIEASLSETKFCESIIARTNFGDLDLSGALSLETIRHEGPSTIGIATLFKSKGRIPEAFLRGCGVPDALIAYLPSLIGAQKAIEFYSSFISYSHEDEEFAKRLHSRMRDEHLRVWYAPEDVKAGRKLHEQIEQAIRVYDKLLLVLSETSMQSKWVATEIYHARQREVKENKRVLFPIRLAPFEAIKAWKCFDADTGKDMAREIREYFIPDFSNWKDHDSFKEGFKRLLDDLKAE